MIDMKRTGQKMKKICKEKGITVKQIQCELNIGAFQSIYGWFQGKTLPALDNFYQLCRMLDVPMESMIVVKEETYMGNGDAAIELDCGNDIRIVKMRSSVCSQEERVRSYCKLSGIAA